MNGGVLTSVRYRTNNITMIPYLDCRLCCAIPVVFRDVHMRASDVAVRRVEAPVGSHAYAASNERGNALNMG